MSWRDKIFGSGPPKDEPVVPEVEEEELPEPNPLEEAVLTHVGDEVVSAVSKVQAERGVSYEESARGLYRALEDGKVRLVDPSPPRGVVGFFSPVYSLWFWLVVGFVGLLIFSIYLMPQVYPLNYLRIGAGAVFVLYVPGYTLIEALYSRRDELERLERFGLSVGLSLAVVPLVGLVLNYTPWGIRLNSILVALSLLTLALAGVAVYRKYGYWRLARGE